MQQQQELEAESAEMQDFLQEEKATLADALKEAETEVCFFDRNRHRIVKGVAKNSSF